MTPLSQNVPRGTFDGLSRYVGLLLHWNRTINLIGKTTERDAWNRHIEEGLQLVQEIPDATKTLADLGSGAGLPGMVVAIARPEMAVTLVERDQRKCAFLSHAARELGLKNVAVDNRPIESLDSRFEVVTARALASLSELCAFAHPLLGTDAFCLFPKGENFAREVAEAQEYWRFTCRVIPSATSEKSCIVSVSELSPKGSTVGKNA